MRTPEDFVASMLRKKESWSGILAVARQIRGGRWREDVRKILVGKGVIPSEHLEEIKQRDKIIEGQRVSKDRREKERKPTRLKGGSGRDCDALPASVSTTGKKTNGSQKDNPNRSLRGGSKNS